MVVVLIVICHYQLFVAEEIEKAKKETREVSVRRCRDVRESCGWGLWMQMKQQEEKRTNLNIFSTIICLASEACTIPTRPK